MTSWRERAEFAAVRSVGGLLTWVPHRVAFFVGRRLGDLMRFVVRSRVRTGRDNLAHSLPELSEAERERILRESFRHFACVPITLLRLPVFLKRRPPSDVLRLMESPAWQAVRDERRTVVFLTGHAGNWEVVGTLGAAVGFPFTAVARAIDNPLIERWLHGCRTRFGGDVVAKDGAMRHVARSLKKGRSVGLMLDQHAGRHGVRVPFFGRDASTYASAAHVARRFGVPLMVGIGVQSKDAHHVDMWAFPPLEPDPSLPADEDHYRMTLYYSRCLERIIREHPEQYLWFHRRWRDGGEEPDAAWKERYATTPCPPTLDELSNLAREAALPGESRS